MAAILYTCMKYVRTIRNRPVANRLPPIGPRIYIFCCLAYKSRAEANILNLVRCSSRARGRFKKEREREREKEREETGKERLSLGGSGAKYDESLYQLLCQCPRQFIFVRKKRKVGVSSQRPPFLKRFLIWGFYSFRLEEEKF